MSRPADAAPAAPTGAFPTTRWSRGAAAADPGAREVLAELCAAYDIVLLEIGLSGIERYEVTRRLRQEVAPTLVALTDCGQEADRRKARKDGFDRHFVKLMGIDTPQSVLAAL
jgi:CheY-like chemotaxis protein